MNFCLLLGYGHDHDMRIDGNQGPNGRNGLHITNSSCDLWLANFGYLWPSETSLRDVAIGTVPSAILHFKLTALHTVQ
nr:hypothetical protein CFP56_09377 [Quercus suber]